MQSNRRQQTERRPKEIHLPPAAIDVGLQDNGNRHRHRKASQQQDAKPHLAVAQRGERTRYALPARRNASNSPKPQRHRRRGYRKSNRDIIPRRGVGSINLAHKQISEHSGMLGQRPNALNKPQRILPIVRVDNPHRRHRRRREYSASP